MSKDANNERRDNSKSISRTFSLKEKLRSKNHKTNLDKSRPSLKLNSKNSTDNFKSLIEDNDNELAYADVDKKFKINKSSVLMQAYRNLLYALFDPTANISDDHFYQMKSFMRKISHDKNS